MHVAKDVASWITHVRLNEQSSMDEDSKINTSGYAAGMYVANGPNTMEPLQTIS